KRLLRRVAGKPVDERASAMSNMVRQADVPILRCGVIGLGLMGRTHVEALCRHPYFKLTGIASQQPDNRMIADQYGSRWFRSAEEMIMSGDVDIVVVATPHWQHADITICALQAGLHVVCEKPLTVSASQADRVLRAAEQSKGLLTTVFQSRFEPPYQRAKSM